MIDNFLKNPINKFLLWFAMGLFVCLIGITNVFALTNDNRIEFYDNNGSSASAVTTYYEQTPDFSFATFTTTANSYGGLVMITLNQPLVKDYIYTIFLNVGASNMGGATRLSTKNCIGLSDSKNGAINNYVSCDISPSYSDYTNSTGDYTRGLYFTFIAKRNGIYLALPYTSQYTCTNCQQYSYGYELNTIGNSADLTQSQLNNVINNQTTYIQNEIANMSSDISDSIQDMGDSINDTINDNMQTCVESGNLSFTTYQNKAIASENGAMVDANGWLATDFIRVYEGVTYTHSGFSSNMIAYYDKDKNYINYTRVSSYTPTSNVSYIRMNSTINNYNGVISHTAYCLNKLDEQMNAINGVNDSINNDNVDENGIASAFDSFNNYLDDNSTITQLITLPVTLYTAILNNLNGTCQPFNLGKLYGSDLILPCINISQYLGNALWSMIDIIISGFAIYAISKKMIKVFNNFSSLREGDVIDD